MAIDLYDIYFSAKVLDGHDLNSVKQSIAKLFRADDAQLQVLFSGKAVRIKSNVDAETAGQYRATLRKAGILIDVLPAGGAAPPSNDGVQVEKTRAAMRLLPANTGSLADCAPPEPEPPVLDIEGMALAAPGAMLAEIEPVPEADIDTSALSAAPPNSGTLEDCAQEKPKREIPDISHIRFVDD